MGSKSIYLLFKVFFIFTSKCKVVIIGFFPPTFTLDLFNLSLPVDPAHEQYSLCRCVCVGGEGAEITQYSTSLGHDRACADNASLQMQLKFKVRAQSKQVSVLQYY